MPAHPDPTVRRRLLLATAAGALLPLAARAQGTTPSAAPAPAAPPAARRPATPRAPVPWQRVHFPRQGGARTLRSQLQGVARGARDYVLRARAGQSLEVELETLAPGASFKVLGPHQKEALFMSEFSAVPRWRGRLPADGEYRVRVSLNPLQRHRGEALRYTLRLALAVA